MYERKMSLRLGTACRIATWWCLSEGPGHRRPTHPSTYVRSGLNDFTFASTNKAEFFNSLF